MSLGQFEALLQQQAPHLRRQSSYYLTNGTDQWYPALYCLQDRCFYDLCLVCQTTLGGTTHNFSAIVVDVVAMGDRCDVKFCASVVMGWCILKPKSVVFRSVIFASFVKILTSNQKLETIFFAQNKWHPVPEGLCSQSRATQSPASNFRRFVDPQEHFGTDTDFIVS